jgi:putative tricarboxylic transport membrane protein
MTEVLQNLGVGFLQVLDWPYLLIAIAGVIVGMVAGVLPGITGIMVLILLLPLTYKMAAVPALILLTSAYVGGAFGGTITAILFNIPGDPDSVPSLWDGHPMARAGQAGKALGIAAFSAVFGGLAGTIVLTFLSEPFAKVALEFSSAEFLSIVVFGLTSVTALGAGSLRLALISLILGLLIGMVGLDDIYGQERFTFGSPILRDGIDFQVVMMGVYALAEVLERLSQGYPSTNVTGGRNIAAKLPGARELLRLWPTLSRATATGMVIGVIPGAGATVGAFVSYGMEKLFCARRRLLGTGIAEGLAAPNAAANATIGGAFIPLLTLGIPGSGATAVILGAFLIKGIQPGPNIFTTSNELVYAIFATQYLALVIMLALTYLSVGLYVKILQAPESIIAALIVIFTVLGAYSLRSSMSDVWLMVGFGILGYVMRRFDFPVAPLVLGVILGPIAERHFMTTMISYHNDLTVFVTRPISAMFLALAAATVVVALIRNRLETRAYREAALLAQD